MSQFGVNTEEDLQLLDAKMKQVRNEYEQYFLGSRPREPQLLRGEVQKMVAYYANVPIQNTALRFKFNNLRARFFSLRRLWDTTLRKIEDGTYQRHLFKAKLHERERTAERAPRALRAEDDTTDLLHEYLEARRRCGQDSRSLDRSRLEAILDQQRRAIRERYGCQEVRFRVVVEEGRAKLKATPVMGG